VNYSAKIIGGELIKPLQFEGQDSLGALWVSEQVVTENNASPLVLKALDWIKNHQLGIDVELYETWEVKK
jgi:hypothetical protein